MFNTVPGKLYIIGEQDVFGGSPSSYFKVGLVKKDRDVEERLLEHQTGNPRKLIIRDLIDVPAVEFLETQLHHRLATKVAYSEWFRLSEEEYKDLVDLANELAKEVTPLVPLANSAITLKDKVSNGIVIPSDNDVWQLHCELYPETAKVKHFNKTIKNLNTVRRNRFGDSDKTAVGQYRKKVEKRVFNASKFQEEHPELVLKFQKETVDGRFTIKKISDMDDELKYFNPLKSYLGISDEDLERVSEVELEQARRHLIEVSAISEWSESHHGVSVRNAIGENDGIENVASWKRSIKSIFDKGLLKLAEPDLYEQYVEIRIEERWVNNNQGMPVEKEEK